MVMKMDHERYARETPFFLGSRTYPPMLSRALEGRSGTFLEVGAGDGGMLRNLFDDRRLKSFQRVIALDVSERRVQRMRRYVPEADARLGDAEHLKIDDASVDCYFSDQVIEHVPSDDRMATEVRRVLKPDGVAVVGSCLRLPGGWWYHRNGGLWRIDPTHVREYGSTEEYAAVFARAGLAVEEIEQEPVRFPVAEMVVRAAMKLRLVPMDQSDIYMRRPFMRRWHPFKMRIPRYYMIYARLYVADR
jgi:ubiquinone/menaquinone biosynthesis C-methylase UbiE